MKTISIVNVFLVVLAMTSILRAQQENDYVNGLLNPVPLQYTLQHFNLKGNVYQVIDGDIQAGNATIHTFKNRMLIERTTPGEYGVKEMYNYSDPAKIVVNQNGDLNTYYLEHGKITSFTLANGYTASLLYTKEGNLRSNTNKKTGNVIALHTYDAEGRIEMSEYFDGRGSRESVDTYIYGKDDTYSTVLIESISPEYKGTEASQMYIDSKGFKFYDEDPTDYAFEYDSNGNWKKYIFNDGKITVERTITYYK